jgi:hypothetical protein
VQPHVGVGADGDPFQDQEQRAQQRKLRGDRSARVDKLREERGEDQDRFRIPW